MKVIACFASTLDGKIADATHPRARFGSPLDLEHLRTVRNLAGAILCGGETFRQYPNVRKGKDRDTPPWQCVLTRDFNLPTDASLFKSGPEVPILVFSPTPPSEAVKARYPHHVEWATTHETEPGALDAGGTNAGGVAADSPGANSPVPAILAALEQRGIETLLVEGGGTVMHQFLEARALQELYLTLCPLFLGGKDDPALVSGLGFSIQAAPRTEVISARWEAQELYLHLAIRYPT